jgi:uncharacterized membrane protein
MAMRLQELHPAIVHFPIALLPTSLGADALGRLTGSQTLLEMGRRTMPLAVAGVALAGLAGFVAQEAVKAEGEAHDALVTHRNLNLGLIGLTALMARKRARRSRPSWSYLAAGLAGLGAMTYSAYLGGHMVYELGVGVKPAGGLHENKAPEIRADNAQEVARLAADHVQHGFRHAMKHLSEGEVAPVLTEGESGEAPAPSA